MLKSGAVVLDFEGFRSKKSGFIIKELAVSTKNYNDTISFYLQTHLTYFRRVSKDLSCGYLNFFMVSRGRQESTLIIICNRFFKV